MIYRFEAQGTCLVLNNTATLIRSDSILYSQMLKEAVEEREWEDSRNRGAPTVEIDLDIDAYIPDLYISDGHQKIEMYKRFRGVT